MHRHLSLFLLACLLLASGGFNPSAGAAPPPAAAGSTAAQPASAPAALSSDTLASAPETALVPSAAATSAGALPTSGSSAELNGLITDNGEFITIVGDTDDLLGTDVSTAGDINGDGYTDVIVGAPGNNTAYIYYGSETGLDTDPANRTTLSGPADFGTAVSTAGDVDGDRLADVVVGAPGANSGQGAAYIFLSSVLNTGTDFTAVDDGIEIVKSGSTRLGAAVGTAGNVNGDTDADGDGLADVIIGTNSDDVLIVFGEETFTGATRHEISNTSSSFGTSVDTAGDVNGDGFADIIVGAPTTGEFYLYAGQTGTTLNSTATLTKTGDFVSAAGDMNGDGFADVLASDPDSDTAYVYFGGADAGDGSPTLTEETTLTIGGESIIGPAGDIDGDGYADILIQSATDEVTLYRSIIDIGNSFSFALKDIATLTGSGTFGSALDTAGDVDGDGYADIIIGAPTDGSSNEGAFYVYRGAPGSLLDQTSAYQVLEKPSSATFSFGHRSRLAGDLNGDGYGDVVVSDWDSSEAYIYYGSANGLPANPDTTLSSASVDDNDQEFGFAIASAGDVNGDGYDDLLVGDPDYQQPLDTNASGQAYLYCGQPDKLADGAAPDWTGTPEDNTAQARYGWNLNTLGDTNGDGYADFIVGAYRQAVENETDSGTAYVYYGAADFCGNGTSEADWRIADQSAYFLGHDVGTAGDVNGDGYADALIGAVDTRGDNIDGEALLFYGSANGLAGPSNRTVGTRSNADWRVDGGDNQRMGHTVSTAGDVNGDGFSDILIGARFNAITDNRVRRAYLFLGSADGPPGVQSGSVVVADDSYAAATLPAFYQNEAGRYDIASNAGDVNGDGLADILVAKYSSLNDATVYLGSDDPADNGLIEYIGAGSLTTPFDDVTHTPAITLTAGGMANFAYGLSAAGDINADGYADVIISSLSQGKAVVYYGNDGLGRSMLPRQLRKGSEKNISYLGASDSSREARLSLLGYTPIGGSIPVELEWEMQEFAPTESPPPSPLTDTSEVAFTQGIPITATVSGLEGATPYKWRTRLLYPAGNRLGQSASRWLHIPRNAETEQDFRSKSGLILSTTSPIIVGTESTLTAILNVQNATAIDYTWTLDIDDPTRLPEADRASFTTTAPDNDTTYTYLSNGTYTAQVVARYTVEGDATIFSLTATATIQVNVDEANLNAALDTDSPTIFGNATTMTATLVGVEPISYLWDFDDGVNDTTTRDPAPNPDIKTHSYTAIGIYTPTVEICYAADCSQSITVDAQVEVVDEPLANLEGTYTPIQATYFVGESIQFDASVEQGTNPVYTWDFGDGTERTGQSHTYAFSEPGIYTVVVSVKNSVNSLQDVIVATITVVERPISGTLTADNDSPTFFGDTTTLSATVSEGTNVYYMWDFGDGETAVTQNRSIGHVYPALGEFEATVTVSNSVTAETVIPAASTTVTIEDRTIKGLSVINDSPTLLGNTTSFTASVTEGTNVEYLWDFTDGTTIDWTTSPTVTHTFAQAGIYDVRVRARNSATTEVALTTSRAEVIGPNLTINKTSNVSEADSGQPITFTLTVENTGNYTATDVIISDELPTGATFVAAPFADGSDNGQLSNGTVTWDVAELAPGSSVAVLLGVTAENTIVNETYGVRTEDQFSLDIAGTDPVAVTIIGDTTLYLPIVMQPGPVVVDLPDLVGSFSLSPNKTTFAADELVTINGRVTNQGNAPVQDAFWVDLFINPTNPPTSGDVPTIWNLRCEQPCIGISWAVTRTLQPGESFTFDSTASSYQEEYTIWEGYLDTNPTSLYLYVDPWASEGAPDREYGAVIEVLETNNRADIENLTVQGIGPVLNSAPKRKLPPRPDLEP